MRLALTLRNALFVVFAVSSVGAVVLDKGIVTDAQAKKIVIKQTSVYVATLPTGCVKTMYGNVVVWRCGTIYYQPYKNRYVRVYIN